MDYLLMVGATFLAAVWLNVPIPVGLVLFSGALAVAVLLASLVDPDEPDKGPAKDHRGGG